MLVQLELIYLFFPAAPLVCPFKKSGIVLIKPTWWMDDVHALCRLAATATAMRRWWGCTGSQAWKGGCREQDQHAAVYGRGGDGGGYLGKATIVTWYVFSLIALNWIVAAAPAARARATFSTVHMTLSFPQHICKIVWSILFHLLVYQAHPDTNVINTVSSIFVLFLWIYLAFQCLCFPLISYMS
jgi:hypothetical protein